MISSQMVLESRGLVTTPVVQTYSDARSAVQKICAHALGDV